MSGGYLLLLAAAELCPLVASLFRVELNFGLILRVDERSSVLSVSGEELATERVSLLAPDVVLVISARERDER